jgi:hypothetical protein
MKTQQGCCMFLTIMWKGHLWSCGVVELRRKTLVLLINVTTTLVVNQGLLPTSWMGCW